VTSIGSNAFYSCSNLTGISLSNNLSQIQNGTFKNCTKLNKDSTFNMPNSVTSIGDFSFYGATFHGVNLSSNLQTIGDEAFMQSDLTGIDIPNGVISIGNDAFFICNDLTGTVTIPETVTSIGSQAFALCNKLSGINCNIPLTSINATAFYQTHANLVIHARASDSTWTAGTNLTIGGNTSVDVIKDL
jgi:hypothetical protein